MGIIYKLCILKNGMMEYWKKGKDKARDERSYKIQVAS